jgi:hypothetical protein
LEKRLGLDFYETSFNHLGVKDVSFLFEKIFDIKFFKRLYNLELTI